MTDTATAAGEKPKFDLSKGKITFEELEELLRRPDIPKKELRRYFTGDKSASRRFTPIIQVDRRKVELDEVDEFRVQGAFAMNWANGVARLCSARSSPT